jgi:hypothetical protein
MNQLSNPEYHLVLQNLQLPDRFCQFMVYGSLGRNHLLRIALFPI